MTGAPDPVISVQAAARLRRLREATPEAARLATLVSLAVRIEPSLLRAVRVAAGLGTAVEAELWFSGAVATAGPRGISLDPAVADVLRDDLAQLPPERDVAWALIRSHHSNAPWSFRLEERINYLSTFGGAGVGEIEELLAAALAELRLLSEQDRVAATALARWLLAALGRLPAIARGTTAAAVAAVAAGVHLDGRVQGLQALGPRERDWLAWLLDFVPSTASWVQRRLGSVRLGGPGGQEHAIRLEVPATNPLVVTVVTGETSTAVRLHAGDDVTVAAPPGPVELRLLNGRRVVLEEAVTSVQRPDPDSFINRHAEQEIFRSLFRETAGLSVLFLVGEPGVGKTALMRRLNYNCKFEDQITAILLSSRMLPSDRARPTLWDAVRAMRRDLVELGFGFPDLDAMTSGSDRDPEPERYASYIRAFSHDLDLIGQRAPLAIFIDEADEYLSDELADWLDKQQGSRGKIIIVFAARRLEGGLGVWAERTRDVHVQRLSSLRGADIRELLSSQGIKGIDIDSFIELFDNNKLPIARVMDIAQLLRRDETT